MTMSKESFKEKYKWVYEQKKLHPDRSLRALCKEAGVSYQAYYLWARKLQESEVGGGQKTGIRVMISVRDMVQYLVSGTSQLTLPIEDVLRSMPPEERSKIASELGRKKLEDLLAEKK